MLFISPLVLHVKLMQESTWHMLRTLTTIQIHLGLTWVHDAESCVFHGKFRSDLTLRSITHFRKNSSLRSFLRSCSDDMWELDELVFGIPARVMMFCGEISEIGVTHSRKGQMSLNSLLIQPTRSYSSYLTHSGKLRFSISWSFSSSSISLWKRPRTYQMTVHWCSSTSFRHHATGIEPKAPDPICDFLNLGAKKHATEPITLNRKPICELKITAYDTGTFFC